MRRATPTRQEAANLREPQPGPSGEVIIDLPKQTDEEKARNLADKLILDAEQFKASITAPLGKSNIVETAGNFRGESSQFYPDMDRDDDFFHLTCHIEPNLHLKIEKGEFVDLDKLLPKERHPFRLDDDICMEMVNHDGVTYFVPAVDRDTKVNNIKCWDQAFRVYAAIYCKQNPARSAEIWQYIYVIHTAAATFQWENVAWYCCDMGQNDTIGKIELNPSFVLSSDNTNYKNDIQ